MLQIILSVLFLGSGGFGQAPAPAAAAAVPSVDLIKKEGTALQAAVHEASQSVPGAGILQNPKATYLEGFGLIVALEVVLEPPRNPFSSPKGPAEIRVLVTERRKQLEDKLVELLKQRTAKLQSLTTTDSLAIIVHLFNANPADLPDVPSQLVLTASRQDPTNVKRRAF